MLERGEGGREPGEAYDRVEHDVDLGQRRELGQHLGGIGTQTGARERYAELLRLRLQQLAVAGGGQGHHFVLVAVVPDDVERLGADGTGGAEDGDPAHQTRPRATTR